MSTRAGRDLSSVSNKVNNFTANQKYCQQILSVTSAAISVVAGLLTFYWFIRMKRKFRHHLIMLLVASQMSKALLYLVPPIAVLIHGRPLSRTSCLATGFLLAVQIEASDFINLLIAIHTALSILRPRKITQESGLFPYRYQAYASFVVFSFLLPSLAFINPGHDAYVSQGTFCALPVRPFWYRLVLSWIPRYLILLIIIGVYMTIYIYTRRTFGTFDATFSSGSMSSQGMGSANSLGKSQDIQVSPEKAIPPCAPKSSWPPTCKLSTRSAIAPRRPGMSCIPPWRKYSFTQRIPVPRGLPENGTSHTKPNNLTSLLSAPGPRHRSDVLSDTVFRTPTLMEALHDPDLLGIKRRIPSPDPNIFLRVRHQEIQRQLRKMFIYPLVYLLMWIPAFVNHCYFYTKNPSPPFALSCISLACLCLQCAVDSLVFSIREKPWLYKVEAEKAERGRKIADAGGDVEMRPLTSEGYGGAVVSGQGIGRHSRNLSDRMNGQSPQQEKHWWDDEGLGTP